MNFWIEFSLILLLCYGYYQLVLAKQPHFQVNRLFLMAMVPLSALLAYVSIPLRGTPEIISILSLAEISIEGLSKNQLTSTNFSWGYVYLAGLLMSASITAFRLLKLWRFIQTHPQRKDGPYTLVYCGLKNSPASFFKYIFWNEQISQNAEERAQILAHEKCHVQQRHSLDRLMVELMLILCWFHPLVYLIRRELLQTHEFLADRAATQDGNIRTYASLLLSRALGSRLQFSHSFFHSPVKKRIMMLQPSLRRNPGLRYLGVLPLLALMVVLFACQPQNQDLLTTVDVEPKPLNMAEVQQKMGYPELALKAGIQGLVVAKVLVDEEGEYLSNTIVKSPDEILTLAVQMHLPELRFEPAMKDGQAVKFYVNIPFNFKLAD